MNVKQKRKLGDKSKRQMLSQRWDNCNKKNFCQYLKRSVVKRPIHIPRRIRRRV